MSVKVVSWNVNGIRALHKKGLADFLKQARPDIFCVQETKANVDQIETELRTLGYEMSHWSSAKRKGYSGVATFLNARALNTDLGIGREEYDSEGRFVINRFEKFDLYNIYFPNGGSGEVRHLFKQQFLAHLAEHLSADIKKGREIIVVGDYNIAHKDIDVYDPQGLDGQSGFKPEERAWFSSFLELGFVYTFRHFFPTTPKKFSWWPYQTMGRMGNRGWRIDYICVTKGLVPMLRTANVWSEVEGSDHCPVVATFDDALLESRSP